MNFCSYIITIKSNIQYSVLYFFVWMQFFYFFNNMIAHLHTSWLQADKNNIMQVNMIFHQLVRQPQDCKVELLFVKNSCQTEIFVCEFISL